MSCRLCKARDSGSTDLCPKCEARADYMLALDDDLETGRPWAEGYCWLSQFSDVPCDGQIRKCHLIAKQTLIREGKGSECVWDPRVWVPGCGGPTGIGGHHGMLDYSRTLRIPREALPGGLEAFAEEYGLGWYLDRTFGPLEDAA